MNWKLYTKIFQELRLPSLLLLPSMDERAPEGLPSCSHRAGLSLRKLSWFLVVVLPRWSKIVLVSFTLSPFISTQRIVRVMLKHFCGLGVSWKKKTDYVFLAGDFNCVDKHVPQLWDKFLMQFQCSDVHPELATYRHSKGVSCLDRVLIPDSLVNSAKLFASASVITSHVANGHDIVKARVSVKPNVLDNPRHPKHEVIPSGVFMPGKDGTPVASNSELQSLIRRLQREHTRLYAHWSADWVSVDDAEGASHVTGRCSPYDNDVNPEDSAQITGCCSLDDNGVPPEVMACVTGRCSPYDGNGSFQLPPQLHPNIRPYCRARKYLDLD